MPPEDTVDGIELVMLFVRPNRGHCGLYYVNTNDPNCYPRYIKCICVSMFVLKDFTSIDSFLYCVPYPALYYSYILIVFNL